MERVSRLARTALTLVCAATIAVAISGCVGGPRDAEPATSTSTGSESNVSESTAAVVAAVGALGGRITAVDAEVVQSGLASGWVVNVEVDGSWPLSAPELEAILRATRAAGDFDAVDISVIAYTPQDGTRVGVDVRSAATELGLDWTKFGAGIVVVRHDLTSLLGEWSQPRG